MASSIIIPRRILFFFDEFFTSVFSLNVCRINMSNDKTLRMTSVLGYALMVMALVAMVWFRKLFSAAPMVIVVQILAALFMVWARITFGSRSFNLAADRTVSSGTRSMPPLQSLLWREVLPIYPC
jgi:hypothetical protein